MPDDSAHQRPSSGAPLPAEQQRDRRDLEHRSHVLSLIAHHTSLGIVLLSQDQTINRVNEAFARVAQMTMESLAGRAVDDLLEPAAVPARTVTAAGSEVQALRLRIGPQAGRIILAERAEILDGGVEEVHSVLLVHDSTHADELRDALERTTRVDLQTGLLSRSYFRKRLETVMEFSRGGLGSAAVCWVNLDGFRSVNDRFGYQAGDTVLREVAHRLQVMARPGDLVARLGADEFAVLMHESDPLDIGAIVGERMLGVIRDAIDLSAGQVHLTASAGIALVPGDGATSGEVLFAAGTAMHAAKEAGGDRAMFFQSEMNRAAEERAAVRHELVAAIRSGSYGVLYQPIVNARTGVTVGVESLIRLMRGSEYVPAAHFIEVAEQTGLVRAIGRIGIQRSIADLARAAGAAPDWQLPVSVNLSPAQLQDVETVNTLLAWRPHGGTQRIVAEVTESVVLQSGSRAMDLLTLLRSEGCRVAIDDFGTGYSSIALLERIRPDSIKIDRSLLVRAREGGKAKNLFAAALGLVRALDAQLIVEGVETRDDLVMCQDLGVDCVQGSFLGPPQPIDAILLATA